jgi:glycosyltransferase involved in cell wall biosynthesis
MLISLCVTTKNRYISLEKLIKSIYVDEDQMLEIVIVDSSDYNDSKLIIDDLKDKYNNIKFNYIKKICNLDEGFYTAAKNSQGEYIWFFSDDDILLPYSINYINKVISEKNLDLIIANSSLYNESMSKCLNYYRIQIDEDECGMAKLNNEIDDLFVKIIGIMGYISCIIISRNLFNSYLRNKKIDDNYYFRHFHYIFSSNKNDGCGIEWKIIKQPLFLTKSEGKSWISNYLIIWGSFFNNTCFNLIDVSDVARQKLNLKCYNCSARFILAAIFFNRGADNLPNYLKKSNCSKFYLFPWFIFKIFRSFKKTIKI